MGIPVNRLGDAKAAALVAEEWRSLANITSPDLKIKCELHGVPASWIQNWDALAAAHFILRKIFQFPDT